MPIKEWWHVGDFDDARPRPPGRLHAFLHENYQYECLRPTNKEIVAAYVQEHGKEPQEDDIDDDDEEEEEEEEEDTRRRRREMTTTTATPGSAALLDPARQGQPSLAVREVRAEGERF